MMIQNGSVVLADCMPRSYDKPVSGRPSPNDRIEKGIGNESGPEKPNRMPNAFRMDPEEYESALAMVKDQVRADYSDEEIIEEIRYFFPGTPWGFAKGVVERTRKRILSSSPVRRLDDETFREIKDRINQAIRDNSKIGKKVLVSEILDQFYDDDLAPGLIENLVDNALCRNEAYWKAFELFQSGLPDNEVVAIIETGYPKIPEEVLAKIVGGARGYDWKKRQEARKARESVCLTATPAMRPGGRSPHIRRTGKTARDRAARRQ